MSELFDESLISDFVVESREHLDAIEPDLLSLEESGVELSDEIINRIFRAIHSIKGGAGFLAYESLKNLSHVMESVLMQVRDGALTITPEIADVLLAGMDKLRAMVDDIHASDSVPCEDEVKQLQALLGEDQPVARTPSKSDAPITQEIGIKKIAEEFGLTVEAIKSAVGRGRYLFRGQAYLLRNIKERSITVKAFMKNIESLGDCIKSTFDSATMQNLKKCKDPDASFTFLFATVLEEELVAAALELPEDQVLQVQLESESAAPQQASTTEAAPAPAPESAPAATPDANKSAGESNGGTEVVETLRVRVDLLTRLMNMAGELVLGRNQLLRSMENTANEIPGQSAILQNIDLITTEMQEGIMQTRMQPVGAVFGKFPRVVRDMSRKLGKEIELSIQGAEVELDKSIIELLGDPLTHLIRNCVDHALEPPEERESAGKKKKGLIEMSAYHQGGQVNIVIKDDGRGIDPEKISKLAIEKGVISAADAERMTPREKINLIFAAGFSTAEVVSDVSGRGVGMDVVRSNIEKLGGTVILDSTLGEGTTVLLQLPLTLAIISSLIVGVGDQRFAIPQVNVDEFVWVRAHEVKDRIERIHGQDVLRLRGTLLPLVRLRDILGVESDEDDRREVVADRRSDGDDVVSEAANTKEKERGEDRRQDWHSDYNIVVLKIGNNSFGALVDKLYDTEEIVVKPLSAFIKECACFSGATILGDGRVITILDVLGIGEVANLSFADLESEEKRRLEEEEKRASMTAKSRKSVILFSSAPTEFFAAPQETVMRLESIKLSELQDVGGKEYIQYRGKGLPIIRLDSHLEVRPLPDEMEEAFLIIPKLDASQTSEDAPAGIMVSRIIDALDVDVDLEQSTISGPGIMGSALVHDQLTVFVDLKDFMEACTAL